MKKTVSIVIICYKDPKIVNCIKSLRKGNNSEIEKEIIVVLVDNPKLERKIRKLGKIKIFFAPKGNLSISRNIGIKKATNENIILLDSDVVVNKDFLPEMLASADNFDIVKSQIVFKYNSFLTKIISKSRLMGHINNAYVPGLLVKNKVFKKIGLFNENICFSEDGEFNFRVKKNKIAFVQINKATIYHPPISIDKDLKMAYKIGRGKRLGYEFGEVPNNEDLTNVIKRFLKGTQIKYFLDEAREWGVLVATYDIFWFFFYYLGYYVQKYKNIFVYS